MSSPLTSFLTGEGCDAAGRTAADVIAMADEDLERHHDYIQWLFPLLTPSAAVPGSPVLSPADVEAIKADPRAREMLERAAERVIGFYTNTNYWPARYDHNHLRISRIIQSLGLLAGSEAATRFYKAIMDLHEAAGAPVNPTSLRYWQKALGAV